MRINFKTVGLIIRDDVQSHLETIQQVMAVLENRTEVLVHCLNLNTPTTELANMPLPELVAAADLVISLGGDGTLLTAARALVNSATPLLGVNLGRLGFLTDVSIHQIEQHLTAILDGHYSVEKRFFIEGIFQQQDKVISRNIALNDIIVHAHQSLNMIEYEVYSNGDLIHRQRADGVIVATPTGSTAYALSGGGPIMHPSLETLVIVPVCPHTLSNRPIVLPADQTIEISLHQSPTLAQINYDGQSTLNMDNSHQIKISRYPQPLTLLHPEGYDYFQILRAKLQWSTNH